MENKEIKVVPPEGYEIDKENSTFECIKFKPIKKRLPETWGEFCNTHPRKIGEWYIAGNSSIKPIEATDGYIRELNSDRNILPSKKLAESMIALCQLIQLRDCYNDGWKPDWTTASIKYIIAPSRNKVLRYYSCVDHKILAFKTEEIRDQFFENFRDLIEIAKPLL